MDPVLIGVLATALLALIGSIYTAASSRNAIVETDERVAQLETLKFLRTEVNELRADQAETRTEINSLRRENARLASSLARAEARLRTLEEH